MRRSQGEKGERVVLDSRMVEAIKLRGDPIWTQAFLGGDHLGKEGLEADLKPSAIGKRAMERRRVEPYCTGRRLNPVRGRNLLHGTGEVRLMEFRGELRLVQVSVAW